MRFRGCGSLPSSGCGAWRSRHSGRRLAALARSGAAAAAVGRFGGGIKAALLGCGRNFAAVVLPNVVLERAVEAAVEELGPRGVLAVAVFSRVFNCVTYEREHYISENYG